jgi:hypothetical protein
VTDDEILAPFDAHELGAGIAIVPERAPRALRRWSITADYARYRRSNDLTIGSARPSCRWCSSSIARARSSTAPATSTETLAVVRLLAR